MKPINLNQIPTEYIMKTKAGNLWRCGRGYRKNWAKLIGKLVLLHNAPYTLINRIKEDGKWYLVFTDGTSNYTERQDKALRNKKLAKDTIIEAVKRVIAGLLPAPKELVDKILEYANIFVTKYKQQQLENPLNYNRRGELKNNIKIKKTWEEFKLTVSQQWLEDPINLFGHKVHFIDICCRLGWKQSKKLYRQLLQYYHPDHNLNYPTQYLEKLNWLNH